MTGARSISLIPLEKVRLWLHEPGGVARLWLGKQSALVAWLGLALAAVSPPHGGGLSLCFYQATTGLPCIGCGLTRSFSCGLRGLFPESFQYHPMGLLILALFLAIAGLSLAPASWRRRVKSQMESKAAVFKGLYLGFASVFVGFGTLRGLANLLW